MHASSSKLLNFNQRKKERKNQINRNTLKAATHVVHVCSKVCPANWSHKKHHLTHTLSHTALHTTNSWWHGFSWSGSLPHGPLSRAHVANSEWNTLDCCWQPEAKKDSSLNSHSIMGKVWVKSFDCANEMSLSWLGTGTEVLQRSKIRLWVSDTLLPLGVIQQHSSSQQEDSGAWTDAPLEDTPEQWGQQRIRFLGFSF